MEEHNFEFYKAYYEKKEAQNKKYQEHRKTSGKSKAYYMANRERYLAYMKEYRKNHPEKKRKYERKKKGYLLFKGDETLYFRTLEEIRLFLHVGLDKIYALIDDGEEIKGYTGDREA